MNKDKCCGECSPAKLLIRGMYCDACPCHRDKHLHPTEYPAPMANVEDCKTVDSKAAGYFHPIEELKEWDKPREVKNLMAQTINKLAEISQEKPYIDSVIEEYKERFGDTDTYPYNLIPKADVLITRYQIQEFLREKLEETWNKRTMDFVLAFGNYWPIAGSSLRDLDALAKEMSEGLMKCGEDQERQRILELVEKTIQEERYSGAPYALNKIIASLKEESPTSNK